MFRRSPAAQSTSSAAGNGNGFTQAASAVYTSAIDTQNPTSRRSVSNTTTTMSNKEDQNLNTDVLFTKHTVLEIKAIQNRLRTDADAKKEELRQMVGERYRDLLQASSSIISIAHSSKRVVEALNESRIAIKFQEDPPLPRASLVASVQDSHLHALQVLAAHMKLLLDAPEHLWRLIERKKFFPAAWLFLLARVIHRALVRSEEQDEETWKSQGVDVVAEFPLIQRQWDIVSQFRSQIIHKATLWLRDASSSIEDTCATLVTLHLLDSRPLCDTLSSMLSQRSKALNIALGTKTSSPSSPSISRQHVNGGITFSFSQDTNASSLMKPRIREVKESLHNVLFIISETMCVARGVFDAVSGPALIERVLGFIQSDVDNKKANIPTELHLTTQILLTNVTSTAHFQLLPRSFQSYRPYVDLTSSSASLGQGQLPIQLNGWFLQSINLLQGAVERWFRDLEAVKEVWSVRLASRRWIAASTLDDQEKLRVSGMVDEICKKRFIEIWTSALKRASATFEATLNASLLTIGSCEDGTGDSPLHFLFDTVALPTLSSTDHDIPLRKYQNTLKQQLLGRTSALDSVLDILERCARHIHEEISLIRAGSRNEAKSMVDSLTQQHELAAKELTSSSLLILEKAISRIEGDDGGSIPEAVILTPNRSIDKSIRKLVFLGQVTEELALRSTFIERIGCGQIAGDAFVDELNALNDTVLDMWKQRVVARILHRSNLSLRVIPISMPGPTPELLQALVALYEASQELTFKWNNVTQTGFMQDVLSLFIELWLRGRLGHGNATGHDLALLQELIKLAQLEARSSETWQELQDRLGQMVDRPKFEMGSVECVKRLQTFMPATVYCRPGRERSPNGGPDKFPNLLRYGPPLTDVQTSDEFAKPGPRFGLLLVAEENSR